MPRPARARPTIEEAELLVGKKKLRALASSRQVFFQWQTRGVPWDLIGPVIVERLSQGDAAHSQDASRAEVEMHEVLSVQGMVFAVASVYGVASKEFQALRDLVTRFVPEVPRAAETSVRPRRAMARHRGTDSRS